MTDRTIDFRYASRSTWACIGRPDDEYKTLIRHDGGLQYGWRRTFRFGLAHVLESPRVKQYSESARSAVTVTVLDYGFATLTLTAFGHEHDGGRRTDVVLWSLQSAPDAPELMGAVRVFIDEQDLPAGRRLNPQDSQVFLFQHHWPEETPEEPRAEESFFSAPFTVQYRNSADDDATAISLMTDPQPLEPGQRIEGAFFIPQNHNQTSDFTLLWAQQALERERQFWQSVELQPLTLQVPDDAVQDMLTASARNILQARVRKNGLPFFNVGPLVYRGLWVVDGHFITEAARYLGWRQDADRALDALLTYCQPDGSIAIMPQHTKETGICLFNMCRYAELTGDWKRLDELWPIVTKAIGYVQELREKAHQLAPDHPCHDLLPESYGDGGIDGPRPEYTTTLWTLAGLKKISQAAARLNREADAARFANMFESLLKAFRAHATRHKAHFPDGQSYLPMTIIPDQAEQKAGSSPKPWQRYKPQTGIWAFCHSIFPGEVFSPNDPLVTELLALLDRVDDEEGIPAGTGWISWRGLWNYEASFSAHVWLYAGHPDKAIDYLYAFANHASSLRVWREEQNLRSHPQERRCGDMPHNWASAEFIRLVRHLLVLERGQDLSIFEGLPTEWLQPEKDIVVEQTPTRFGPVSVRLHMNRQMRAEITVRRSEWDLKPKHVTLRLPAGAVEIRMNGESMPTHDTQFVELPDRLVNTIEFQWRR